MEPFNYPFILTKDYKNTGSKTFKKTSLSEDNSLESDVQPKDKDLLERQKLIRLPGGSDEEIIEPIGKGSKSGSKKSSDSLIKSSENSEEEVNNHTLSHESSGVFEPESDSHDHSGKLSGDKLTSKNNRIPR